MMEREYWTLLERESSTAPWCIAFGAYDLEDVAFEREDMRDHGVKAFCLKIVVTGDLQREIDAKVAELNETLD